MRFEIPATIDCPQIKIDKCEYECGHNGGIIRFWGEFTQSVDTGDALYLVFFISPPHPENKTPLWRRWKKWFQGEK